MEDATRTVTITTTRRRTMLTARSTTNRSKYSSTTRRTRPKIHRSMHNEEGYTTTPVPQDLRGIDGYNELKA
eukprot:6302429-Amphidinium_carterae.1